MVFVISGLVWTEANHFQDLQKSTGASVNNNVVFKFAWFEQSVNSRSAIQITECVMNITESKMSSREEILKENNFLFSNKNSNRISFH